MDDLPQRQAVVARESLDKRNIVGDEAIRAALAGIAVELDESGLDERRPRWPKFMLAAVGGLATIGIIALVAGVVWRKQTAPRAVVPAGVTAPPIPAVATESPKTKPTTPEARHAVVATIAVDQTKLHIAVGHRATLTVTIIGDDGSGIDGGTVTWTSSRKRVATVSSNGVVTGRRAGTAKITATSGGKRSSVVVTITAREKGKSQQP